MFHQRLRGLVEILQDALPGSFLVEVGPFDPEGVHEPDAGFALEQIAGGPGFPAEDVGQLQRLAVGGRKGLQHEVQKRGDLRAPIEGVVVKSQHQGGKPRPKALQHLLEPVIFQVAARPLQDGPPGGFLSLVDVQFRQQPFQLRDELRGGGAQVGTAPGGLGDQGAQQIGVGGPLRQQMAQRASQPKNVGRRGPFRMAAPDFRRGERALGIGSALLPAVAGEAEVDEHRVGAALVQDDVFGADVPVDDAVGVQEPESPGQFEPQVGRQRNRQFAHFVGKAHAFHPLVNFHPQHAAFLGLLRHVGDADVPQVVDVFRAVLAPEAGQVAELLEHLRRFLEPLPVLLGFQPHRAQGEVDAFRGKAGNLRQRAAAHPFPHRR